MKDRFIYLVPPEVCGQQVRAMRKARGWTQRQLAERSGLSLKTIGNCEGENVRFVQTRTLCRIAEAFDVALVARFGTLDDVSNSMTAPLPPSFEEDRQLRQQAGPP